MTTTYRPLRRHELSSKPMPENHLAIIDLETQMIITLSPFGAIIWDYCNGELTSEEITEELSVLLPKDEIANLEQAVKSTLEEFSKCNLLEVSF